jgi:hypothetical protein
VKIKPKHYYKKMSVSEFIKKGFFGMVIAIIIIILVIPSMEFIEWILWGSGPFLFFETGIYKSLNIIVVICFLIWVFKGYKDLFDKMQKVPFLSIGEQKIVLDREILPFPLYIGGKGVIKLKWSDIQKIEMEQTTFIVHYRKNGKTKSQKVGLKWVENTEDLLESLKKKCQQENVTWVE